MEGQKRQVKSPLPLRSPSDAVCSAPLPLLPGLQQLCLRSFQHLPAPEAHGTSCKFRWSLAQRSQGEREERGSSLRRPRRSCSSGGTSRGREADNPEERKWSIVLIKLL
ncbi:hypothetical protein COCON_G00045630 [Conger conger]|uniref:Uncharacterized protein n=1 Tax=Conger conger TaxID=82655 RepID=A0A9Q1I4A8_CONCO|nr:hypothetical protein COCON_G00045630 [Conger conger]